LGLLSIRERARLVGGKAEVRSVPGQGTSVSVEIPEA
jgi:signal transduction histidine kinase